jgi:hypothetical protein
VFEPSSKAVEFEALTDTQFIVGSATPHEHDLVLGYYSVHTSPEALRAGEAQISSSAFPTMPMRRRRLCCSISEQ